VAAKEVVAFAQPGHLNPACKVLLLLFWFLCEEIVSNAERHLAALVQFLDNRVIFRVILKPAARVNDTRKTEPIEFTHEMARRIQLMFWRLLWSFRMLVVEDREIG